MFSKNKKNSVIKHTSNKKDNTFSILSVDMNIVGNLASEGDVDFDGTLHGNMRCNCITVRANGQIKGEVVANDVFVYGVVKGLIRAKNVHLFAGSIVEGIIMHETLSIEDGATIDGKLKRTDRLETVTAREEGMEFSFDDSSSSTETRMLDNIRLIHA